MRIELENGRIPTGIRTFYAVRGIRSGLVVSRWTDGCEAQADCDALNKATGFWAPAAKEVVKLSFC
jgi:hypothetical protein